MKNTLEILKAIFISTDAVIGIAFILLTINIVMHSIQLHDLENRIYRLETQVEELDKQITRCIVEN